MKKKTGCPYNFDNCGCQDDPSLTGAQAKYEAALKNSQNFEPPGDVREALVGRMDVAGFEERVTSETGGQKGQKLAQLGAIDPRALLALARVAGHGNQKYDRYNMMKGYDWSLSFDAALRHLLAFWAGEDMDAESGEAHVAHAAWHFLNLYSYMLDHRDFDDRPPCRRESS